MTNDDSNAQNEDARLTVVIVGDDGRLYKLRKADWEQYRVEDEGKERAGVITELKEWGTHLAYLPLRKAAGFGLNCTVVNLRAILKGDPTAVEDFKLADEKPSNTE